LPIGVVYGVLQEFAGSEAHFAVCESGRHVVDEVDEEIQCEQLHVLQVLVGVFLQQPHVVFHVDLAQESLDEVIAGDDVQEGCVAARVQRYVVHNQHADLFELQVFVAPVEHLISDFASVSADVFVVGEVLQDDVQK